MRARAHTAASMTPNVMACATRGLDGSGGCKVAVWGRYDGHTIEMAACYMWAIAPSHREELTYFVEKELLNRHECMYR